jgi:predicted RNA-binding protein with PIN domain
MAAPMRYLVDGYNVMFAGVTVPKPCPPDKFRKLRTRFLDDVAATLGAVDAFQTTVVFDAADAPAGLASASDSTHKGMSVVYAGNNETADDRIEELIAAHPRPRSLTVVSTDHRIRQAASRRKADTMTADAFWVMLDARKMRPPGTVVRSSPPPAPRPAAGKVQEASLTAQESAYWLEQFRDLENDPQAGEALGTAIPMLTDEEIAEIERQVEREKNR